MSEVNVIESCCRVSFTPADGEAALVLLAVGDTAEAEPVMEGGPQVTTHELISRRWAVTKARGNAQFTLSFDVYGRHESHAAARAYGWKRWLELTLRPEGVLCFQTGFPVGAENSPEVDWEFDAVVQRVEHVALNQESSPYEDACGSHLRYEVLLTNQRAAGDVAEWVQRPQGDEEDNANAHGFVVQVLKTGLVTAVEVECCSNRVPLPADVPVWVKVWNEAGELLAVSADSQVHAIGAVLRWNFTAKLRVKEAQLLWFTFHSNADPEPFFCTGEECCFCVVRKVTGEAGGMLNAAGAYSSTAVVPKYALKMRRSD